MQRGIRQVRRVEPFFEQVSQRFFDRFVKLIPFSACVVFKCGVTDCFLQMPACCD